MNNPLELLRLTLPEPKATPSLLENTISVKNWSVGTLLSAIIVQDQNGKLAAQLTRDGVPLSPSLPLPDYPSLKLGDTLLLKVVQMQPQVHLQITDKPKTMTSAQGQTTVKQTNNALIDVVKNAVVSTNTFDHKTKNVSNVLSDAPQKNNTLPTTTIDKLNQALFSSSTATRLPLPNYSQTSAQRIWQTNVQNNLNEPSPLKDLSLKFVSRDTLLTNTTAIKTPQDRANALVQTLQLATKTIWPQQRELKSILPSLVPVLKTMTVKQQQDFVGKVFQWSEHLSESADSFLASIPTARQLISHQDGDLPKPLRAWFRQWMQHEFGDAEQTMSDADNTTAPTQQPVKTLQQLAQLIRLANTQITPDDEAEPTSSTTDSAIKATPTEKLIGDKNTNVVLKNPAFLEIPGKEKNSLSFNENTQQDLDQLIQATVARLQQHSLSNLQSEARGTPQWTAELPVLFQNRCDVFDVMIEADHHQKEPSPTTTPPHFVVRLRFDLPELGPCQFILQLRGNDVDLNVYSERDSTQCQFATEFSTLAKWLAHDQLHLNQTDSFIVDHISERAR